MANLADGKPKMAVKAARKARKSPRRVRVSARRECCKCWAKTIQLLRVLWAWMVGIVLQICLEQENPSTSTTAATSSTSTRDQRRSPNRRTEVEVDEQQVNK